jgi:hypothetical protein
MAAQITQKLWLRYTQLNNMNNTKNRETRILERINGEWKLAFVSGLTEK